MISAMPVYDDIRNAINNAQVSRYRIAQDTGISEAQLCGLMNGTKGLSVEALERLADYLGMEVVARPIKRTKAKRKGR